MCGHTGDKRPVDFLKGIHRALLFLPKDVMRKYLDDILVMTGCAVVVYGVSQLSPVAAWIVSGIFLIIGGIVLAKTRAE